MKKQKLTIRWDKRAKDNLDKIQDYIAKDSIPAARHVKKELNELPRGRAPKYQNNFSCPSYIFS